MNYISDAAETKKNMTVIINEWKCFMQRACSWNIYDQQRCTCVYICSFPAHIKFEIMLHLFFFFFFLDKGTKCCQKTHFSKQKHKISQVDITNMTNSYFIWSISHCKTNGKLLVKDLQLDYLHSHQGSVYKHWVGIKWGSKSAYIISYIHITIYENKVPYVPSCLLLTMNTDACISVEK